MRYYGGGRRKEILTKGGPKGMANFTGVKGPEPHLLVPDTADFLHEVCLIHWRWARGRAPPAQDTCRLSKCQIAESSDTDVMQVLRGKKK